MTVLLFIANASPLIAFERLHRLDLLPQLCITLHTPSAVRCEVFGARPVPAWIVERPLSQPVSRQILAARLGIGESEAIAPALEITPMRYHFSCNSSHLCGQGSCRDSLPEKICRIVLSQSLHRRQVEYNGDIVALVEVTRATCQEN